MKKPQCATSNNIHYSFANKELSVDSTANRDSVKLNKDLKIRLKCSVNNGALFQRPPLGIGRLIKPLVFEKSEKSVVDMMCFYDVSPDDAPARVNRIVKVEGQTK